jgi:small subunit ribosomal protein S6
VKRYEGLFILDIAGKEEGIKEAIDKITAELNNAGAKVEAVQKLDKRQFTRVADKRHSSGFYVNVIFNSEPSVVSRLPQRFVLNEEVFRVLFTSAPEPKAEAAK